MVQEFKRTIFIIDRSLRQKDEIENDNSIVTKWDKTQKLVEAVIKVEGLADLIFFSESSVEYLNQTEKEISNVFKEVHLKDVPFLSNAIARAFEIIKFRNQSTKVYIILASAIEDENRTKETIRILDHSSPVTVEFLQLGSEKEIEDLTAALVREFNDNQAPVVAVPVIETPAPVVEEPVVETPVVPVEETPVVPVEEVPVVEAPVEEIPVVIEEPAAPVEETPVAVEEPAPVVEEPVVEETPAPVVEEPKEVTTIELKEEDLVTPPASEVEAPQELPLPEESLDKPADETVEG